VCVSVCLVWCDPPSHRQCLGLLRYWRGLAGFDYCYVNGMVSVFTVAFLLFVQTTLCRVCMEIAWRDCFFFVINVMRSILTDDKR